MNAPIVNCEKQQRRSDQQLSYEISECIVCFHKVPVIDTKAVVSELLLTCRCNVAIHKKCLQQWHTYKACCPLCRAPTKAVPMSHIEMCMSLPCSVM